LPKSDSFLIRARDLKEERAHCLVKRKKKEWAVGRNGKEGKGNTIFGIQASRSLLKSGGRERIRERGENGRKWGEGNIPHT